MGEFETQKFFELMPRRNNWTEEKLKFLETGRCETLVSNRFVANDFVTFDHCGDTNARGAIFRSLLYANHLAHRSNEYFRAPRDFGRQRERNIKFGVGAQVLINREVHASR